MRVVRTETRRGFAAACNLGARESRGELLAFLNDDTRPHPHWLSRLAAALRARGDAGLAASLIVGFGGETIDSAGDGYLRCGGAFKQRHGEPALGTMAGGRSTASSASRPIGEDVRRLRRGLHDPADAVRGARRFRRRL